MDDEQQENDGDTDLGSGGAIVLPPIKDSAGTIWYLAAGAGKDANLYLVNRNAWENSATINNIYQELPEPLSGGIAPPRPSSRGNSTSDQSASDPCNLSSITPGC